MDKILLLFSFIIICLVILKIFRSKLYNYITDIDKKAILKDTNSYYNNYFQSSEKKNNRQLINNVAFIRNGLISNIYDADIKILDIKKLKDGDKILIFNNTDCNFEIFLAQKILEKEINVEIFIAKTNVLEVEKCDKLISNLGFKNLIKVIFINEFEKINETLGKHQFTRIILRENIGRFENRNLIFSNLKPLLKDDSSFIYLKTLVFENLNADKEFMIEKQLNIIDFWNYNFSTSQDIINDLLKENYDVNFKKVNVLFLSLFYNPQDVINIIKLYFVDLDLGISNIFDWLAVYTLQLLNIKAYKGV